MSHDDSLEFNKNLLETLVQITSECLFAKETFYEKVSFVARHLAPKPRIEHSIRGTHMNEEGAITETTRMGK